MKQPGKVDYSDEGGPTPSCGPSMADGRGPKRYQNKIQSKKIIIIH
jgi:hypothetical protein